jgi:nitroreductase
MLEAIKKRRSIRKFKSKEVEQEKLNEILKAAMYSPSAMNKRPWEFIVVRDQEMKDKLSKTTPWCGFIKDASVVLVMVGREENSYLWIEGCSIATENIYLEAQNQGLGTCFCQVLEPETLSSKDREEYVKQLFKIPEGVRVLCLMPIGYPDEKKEEHRDKEFDKEKIHLDKW